MTKAKEYIAYQGDRPLGTGTVRELSKSLNIPYSTLSFSASPSAHERSRVRGGDNFKFDTRLAYVFQGTIYFESDKKAQQAIESVGEDRIKKYIFGVGD